MKYLKAYNNLYRMRCSSINKVKIPFFISVMFFVLAFATFLMEDFPFGLTLVMMGMIFPAILFGIIWIIFTVRTKKYLQAFSPQQLNMINNEIPLATMCDGLLVTSQALIDTKAGMQLAPMANILWIYPYINTTKLEGLIQIHKDTFLTIAGRNKKMYAFRIKNNQKAYHFVQSELLRYRLDIVFGFEPGMDEIYKNDINRMIAFSQECGDKRRQSIALAQRREF